MHGRIDDHPNVVPPDVWQFGLLDLARQDGVRRLEGSDGSDRLRPLHLSGAEIGNTEIAHLAFAREARHLGPAFFDIFVGFRPVNLVEVDDVDFQAPQAGFTFTTNGFSFQRAADLSFLVPHALTLGEDVGTRTAQVKCAGDHLLGMTQAVNGSGVDPVNAEIKRRLDGGYRIAVVLRTPGPLPTASAHRPCANADGSNLQVARPQLPGLHRSLPRPLQGCFAPWPQTHFSTLPSEREHVQFQAASMPPHHVILNFISKLRVLELTGGSFWAG